MKKYIRRLFWKTNIQTNYYFDLKDKYEEDFKIEYYTHRNNQISYIHYWFKWEVYDFKILGCNEFLWTQLFEKRINNFYKNFHKAIKTAKYNFDWYKNEIYYNFNK